MERALLNKPETQANPAAFSQEVAWIKTNTQLESEPWYLLPNTGFNIIIQVNQFEQDLRQPGERRQVFEQAFQKVEQDILGFKTEYLCQGLLFPIVLKKIMIDGKEEIVGGLYADKPLEDTVDVRERHGTVKDSIIKVVEFLKTAPRGSVAILTSPEGWSGLRHPNGKAVTYADTQTYIWRVMENGEPLGFTARTDMNLAQNKKLLICFGKDPKNLKDLNADISQVTNSPIFLPALPGSNLWQFADVVDVIKSVKGSDLAYKNRSFDEIYQQLQNPEALWTIDSTTKEFTDQLKTFLWEKIDSGTLTRADVEIAVGITVLKLADRIRPQAHSNHKVDTNFGIEKPLLKQTPGSGYISILKDVQQLIGCNGGGDSEIFNGTISSRYSMAESTLNCTCPFCYQRVDAIISMGKITCPRCEKSAPYKC